MLKLNFCTFVKLNVLKFNQLEFLRKFMRAVVMKLMNKIVGAVCLTVAFCSGVQANLISNGSFEAFDAANGIGGKSENTWKLYSEIEGWDDSQNVEIWKTGFLGVDAADGSFLLELNAHASDLTSAYSIFQEFDTIVGATYELTFASQKRSGNANQEFSVAVDGANGIDLSQNVNTHIAGDWTYFDYSFVASSDLSKLTFTSLDNLSDTTGNLFDDVSVIAIPEPGILMLMVAGIAGLLVRRKQA